MTHQLCFNTIPSRCAICSSAELTLVKLELQCEGDLDAPADRPAGTETRPKVKRSSKNLTRMLDSEKVFEAHWCACVFCQAATGSSSDNGRLSPSPPSGWAGPGWTGSGSEQHDLPRVDGRTVFCSFLFSLVSHQPFPVPAPAASWPRPLGLQTRPPPPASSSSTLSLQGFTAKSTLIRRTTGFGNVTLFTRLQYVKQHRYYSADETKRKRHKCTKKKTLALVYTKKKVVLLLKYWKYTFVNHRFTFHKFLSFKLVLNVDTPEWSILIKRRIGWILNQF